jgi:hypothetical protein
MSEELSAKIQEASEHFERFKACMKELGDLEIEEK